MKTFVSYYALVVVVGIAVLVFLYSVPKMRPPRPNGRLGKRRLSRSGQTRV